MENEDTTPAIPSTFMKGAQQFIRIFEWDKLWKRQTVITNKSNQLLLFYNKQMQTLVNDFYEKRGSSEEENQELFELLNKSWKVLVYKGNSRNKNLNLRPDAFEKTIAHNQYIFIINRKEPRLNFECLYPLKDELLKELYENEAQRKSFADEYIHQMDLKKEENKTFHLKVVK